MKVFHIIIGLVLFVVLIVMGVWLVASTMEYTNAHMSFLFDHHNGKFILGSALILLTLLYALTGIPTRDRARYLSFENEGGTVSVSIKAVNDFLAKMADEFSGIVRLVPDVFSRNKTIEVRLNLSVRSSVKIQELSQLLQQRVRENMRDSLGLDEVKTVTVLVKEIIPEDPAQQPPQSDRTPDWQDIST